MNLEISRAFAKDVAVLPGNVRKQILAIIREIQDAKLPHDLNDCVKLKGADSLYRIRMGNYRITFDYQDAGVILKRALPRGKVYKKPNLR